VPCVYYYLTYIISHVCCVVVVVNDLSYVLLGVYCPNCLVLFDLCISLHIEDDVD